MRVQSVLYHSLLASSAFHLARCDPTKPTYYDVGNKHQRHAIVSLQSAIESSPPAEYKVLLMAMLSLVAVNVSGTLVSSWLQMLLKLSDSNIGHVWWRNRGTNFAVHLDGTKVLRDSRRSWRLISSITQQLQEISAFLCLLARTTSLRPSPTLWSDENSHFPDSDILPNHGSGSCFEYMYGIAFTIAEAIQETCRLSECVARYEASSEEIPDTLLQA